MSVLTAPRDPTRPLPRKLLVLFGIAMVVLLLAPAVVVVLLREPAVVSDDRRLEAGRLPTDVAADGSTMPKVNPRRPARYRHVSPAVPDPPADRRAVAAGRRPSATGELMMVVPSASCRSRLSGNGCVPFVGSQTAS